MARRVVVSGLGVVSSVGLGHDDFWQNVIAGKSGISTVDLFDMSSFDVKKGGQVKLFDASRFISKNRLKNIARASQFAIAATSMAFEDAQLDIGKMKNKRIGSIIGTTMADIQSLEEIDKYWTLKSENDVWAINIVKYPANELSAHSSYFFGLNGPNYVIPTACASGNYAIGFSYDLIRQGKVDMMIAGGSDPFSRITFTGFSRLYAMAPEKCQPFDKNRKGMMVGEGCGILFLEELESAKRRNAPIYAEVLGYSLSCDANHMTAPRMEGITKVMEKAIKIARVNKEDVGYICSHGTGTPANDKIECAAIKEVFGVLANTVCVSSLKSMLGHTMGAASAIEAVSCCLAVKEGIIPPTINYETPDPECDIDCVPNKARKKELQVVLNNSFAFGGNNACVVFGKYN